jgi:tRNA A-37 threonylcarbamoyl transferase component Bud32
MRDNIIAPMHAAGWHHHDLAERNVVVDRFKNLTLIDFQLATRDCVGGDDCSDNDFLQFHGLLPIPPTFLPSDL